MSTIDDMFKIFRSDQIGGTVSKSPGKDFWFQKSALPNVRSYNPTYQITDPDILKLDQALIKDKLAHRHKLFWDDNATTSFGYMTSAVLVGEGIKVTVTNDEKASDIIENWNDEINEKHQTIEDYITDTFLDNLIDARSLWRIWKNDNAEDWEPKIDLQRVSMSSVNTEVHPTRGSMRFIQRTNIPIMPFSKKEFYRRSTLNAPATKYVEIKIPNEPNCCIYTTLFNSPPVKAILPLLVLKRWSYMFMRKFLEKYWAPFIVGYVGDPKNGYMPQTEEDQKESIAWTADVIRKVRDFGGAALLATTRLETLDTKSAKTAQNYIDVIDHLNEQIVLGIYGTMSIRESSGNSKGGQDIAQQAYLRTLRGFRQKIALGLKKFYAAVLLPAYGVNGKKPEEIKITFPLIKMDSIKDVMAAVDIAAKLGAFTGVKEIRKILNTVWKHIDEHISDEDAKRMEATFIEMNAPSRAPEDVPQTRASGKPIKPVKPDESKQTSSRDKKKPVK